MMPLSPLPQELWGSVDSLASDSLASDYSMSLDSRQLMTDPSWRTYSLDTGYSRDGGPPTGGYSRENTADVASAVSRLARSVSQLSLEMETAACDDASLPAETGAELSELGADGDEAADLVDGVVELRHDGVNAVRRYESLEALQSARGDPGSPGEGAAVAAAAAVVAAAADLWPFEPRPGADEAGESNGIPAAVQTADVGASGPGSSRQQVAGSLPIVPEVPPVLTEPRSTPTDVRSTPTPTPADARSTPTPTPADAPLTPTGRSDPRSTPTPTDRTTPDRRSTPTPTPTPITPPTATTPTPASTQTPGSDVHHPHVIVLGLRTKRTPEREPRTVSFRLGGDAGHVLASCRVDGDSLPPQSAVLIRETETRAGRPGGAAGDGALQTSLQLEIRGMEATAAPPRADWSTRLQAAVRADTTAD